MDFFRYLTKPNLCQFAKNPEKQGRTQQMISLVECMPVSRDFFGIFFSQSDAFDWPTYTDSSYPGSTVHSSTLSQGWAQTVSPGHWISPEAQVSVKFRPTWFEQSNFGDSSESSPHSEIPLQTHTEGMQRFLVWHLNSSVSEHVTFSAFSTLAMRDPMV